LALSTIIVRFEGCVHGPTRCRDLVTHAVYSKAIKYFTTLSSW
jgi:hypothetical protein